MRDEQTPSDRQLFNNKFEFSRESAELNQARDEEYNYSSVFDCDSLESADFSTKFSNNTFWPLFIQAIPFFVLIPLRRIGSWFFISIPWIVLMTDFGINRFVALVIAILMSRVLLMAILPLIGIALKWLIIGRYKPGRYPLWGQYYLRWWLVEQILLLCGKGIFELDTAYVRLYWVLLGATIGENCKIAKNARLGQPDLVVLGKEVALDK